MESKTTLNTKEKQLVYLSASIAAGCQPCTRYHIRKSKEGGLSDTEINQTIALAISIREEATLFMNSFSYNPKASKNKQEENKVKISCNEALIGIAANYSVNFPSGLQKYLHLVKNIGISNKKLGEIISISKSVIDKARAHVDMVTDKIGVEKPVEDKEDCCSSCC